MFPLVHNSPIFIAQRCKDKSVFQHLLRPFGICSNASKSNSAMASRLWERVGDFWTGRCGGSSKQPLLCIEPLNVTATWRLFTNTFGLWSALGSYESHWLHARHDNLERGTAAASFVSNGTPTSAISATPKQEKILKFLPRRKLLYLPSKMSCLFLTQPSSGLMA